MSTFDEFEPTPEEAALIAERDRLQAELDALKAQQQAEPQQAPQIQTPDVLEHLDAATSRADFYRRAAELDQRKPEAQKIDDAALQAALDGAESKSDYYAKLRQAGVRVGH